MKPTGPLVLIANRISKSIEGRPVLHEVDVTLRQGTITAVLGPNGCGKSTLVRALSLVDPPESGEISIDTLVYRFPLKSRQPSPRPWPAVTLVPQQLFLWPHLSLQENALLAVRTGDRKRELREAAADLHHFVGLLGLHHLMERYPNQVSQGERQRVALLRALILRPRFLLLDEVTSAQDLEGVRVIMGILAQVKSRGIGILVVTHMPGFAQAIADEFVFMDHGRVIEAGSIDRIASPHNERVKQFLSIFDISTPSRL